ncbi:MAG: hypothetical protein ACKN9W_12485 [Methylococcus sp.]
MKLIFRACILFVVAIVDAIASPKEYEALEKKALSGDYQAQRNVAYWLSGGNNGVPPINEVLACAWRIVILKSGSPSVDSSDVSNKKLYCDKKLDADSREAANAQATKIMQRIKSGS